MNQEERRCEARQITLLVRVIALVASGIILTKYILELQ